MSGDGCAVYLSSLQQYFIISKKHFTIMCVICIKKKGVKYPTKRAIQNCCNANPDGFAMMWNDVDGCVHNYKSLNKDEFLRFYDEFVKTHDAKTTGVVIHARIKTHGSLKIENCHCWTALSNSIGFAHNGVLKIKNRGDLTDSETFFRDIFVPVWEWSGCDWKVAEKSVDAIIDTSRFAFLEGDGSIRHYGSYLKHKGCLFSNASYEDRVYYSSTNYDSGGYGYNSSKWDYDGWAYNYYRGKNLMFTDNTYIYKKNISDERWKLMQMYYLGKLSEKEYVKSVLTLPRAEKDTCEWYMDEPMIMRGEYPITAKGFDNKKTWELYLLTIFGYNKYDTSTDRAVLDDCEWI